jgi:hypothetical protein
MAFELNFIPHIVSLIVEFFFSTSGVSIILSNLKINIVNAKLCYVEF